MKRIFHLMPNQDIGGVEIAARSLPTGRHGELEFERNYLVRNPNSTIEAGEYHGPTISLNNPHAYWHAFWRLLRKPPDLLVASLWRSALVLILLKLARPKQKTILFLHSVHDMHWLDFIVKQIAMRLADGIWADSSTTLNHSVSPNLQHKGRVISFLLDRHFRLLGLSG